MHPYPAARPPPSRPAGIVIRSGARPGEFRTSDPFVCALSLTKSVIVPQTEAKVSRVAVGVGLGLDIAATVATGVGDAVLTGAAVQAAMSTGRNRTTRGSFVPR